MNLDELFMMLCDRENYLKNDHRAQQRQGNVAEDIAGLRAIDPRGLIQLGVDRLQAGQEDNHRVAGPLPDRHHRNRWLEPG